jgi:toxin ParE1/3/4
MKENSSLLRIPSNQYGKKSAGIMMKFEVIMLKDAEDDILDIYEFFKLSDSGQNALKLIDKLEEACESISEFPQRGHFPPELEYLGIYDFKEIHFKPYRIIYRIIEKSVIIYCVLDGRRNFTELLEKRLLR